MLQTRNCLSICRTTGLELASRFAMVGAERLPERPPPPRPAWRERKGAAGGRRAAGSEPPWVGGARRMPGGAEPRKGSLLRPPPHAPAAGRALARGLAPALGTCRPAPDGGGGPSGCRSAAQRTTGRAGRLAPRLLPFPWKSRRGKRLRARPAASPPTRPSALGAGAAAAPRLLARLALSAAGLSRPVPARVPFRVGGGSLTEAVPAGLRALQLASSPAPLQPGRRRRMLRHQVAAAAAPDRAGPAHRSPAAARAGAYHCRGRAGATPLESGARALRKRSGPLPRTAPPLTPQASRRASGDPALPPPPRWNGRARRVAPAPELQQLRLLRSWGEGPRNDGAGGGPTLTENGEDAGRALGTNVMLVAVGTASRRGYSKTPLQRGEWQAGARGPPPPHSEGPLSTRRSQRSENGADGTRCHRGL